MVISGLVVISFVAEVVAVVAIMVFVGSELTLIGKVLVYDTGGFVEIFPHFGFAQIVTSPWKLV